jgi:hypothetical protein
VSVSVVSVSETHLSLLIDVPRETISLAIAIMALVLSGLTDTATGFPLTLINSLRDNSSPFGHSPYKARTPWQNLWKSRP